MLIACLATSILIAGINYAYQAYGFLNSFLPVSAEYFDSFTHPGGDNVSGFAWSSTIGWISFNASNCDSEDPGDGNTDTGNYSNCPTGQSTPAPPNDYGVHIDRTRADLGNFSGYAWSSNVGWVSFQDTAPDYSFNSNCNNPNCTSGNNCSACFNYYENKTYGWAHILALGDDGWVKLNNDSSDPVAWQSLQIDLRTATTSGWAWNEGTPDNTGIGWISYNSSDCDTNNNGYVDSGMCGGDDSSDVVVPYGVTAEVNTVPEARNLTAPNWNQANACPNVPNAPNYGNARGAVLTWDFVDPDPSASGTAYHLVVSEEGGSDIIDTCKCDGLNSCANGGDPSYCRITLACMSSSGSTCYYRLYESDLEYDTSYEWQVTVWDNYDISSTTEYYEANDSGVIPGTNAEDGDPETFTTYAHEFPEPYFEWFPQDPSTGEEVKFTDTSIYHDYDTPTSDTVVACDEDGGGDDVCHEWDWNPTGGYLVHPPSDSSEELIMFESTGDWGVDLTVTDEDGYFCSTSTNLSGGAGESGSEEEGVEVKEDLPGWREVK